MSQENNGSIKPYSEQSLQELKDLANLREITPNGNKSRKDTWVEALKESDRQNTVDDIQTEKDLPPAPIIEDGLRTEAELTPEVLSKDLQNRKVDPVLPVHSTNEAQDYILDNIVTPLDQRRIDVNRLEILVDGQNVFKMKDGDVARSNITDRQVEQIQQALNDPQSLKGSIKITNGRQVLLHVKDGQVLRDGLNMTKTSTKIEINSPAADLYDKYSKGVNGKGLQATKKIAKNALADGIERDRVTQIIKSKDSNYRQLLSSAGRDNADRTLNRIVTSADAEIKNRQQGRSVSQEQKSLSRSR